LAFWNNHMSAAVPYSGARDHLGRNEMHALPPFPLPFGCPFLASPFSIFLRLFVSPIPPFGGCSSFM
jgi:hypothetical protein